MSNTAKHTPGPWFVAEAGLFKVASITHSTGIYADEMSSDESIQADARLIAAAPDLLEALQGLLNVVNDSRGVAGYHLNGDTAEWDEFYEVDAARAAITKATGSAA